MANNINHMSILLILAIITSENFFSYFLSVGKHFGPIFHPPHEPLFGNETSLLCVREKDLSKTELMKKGLGIYGF